MVQQIRIQSDKRAETGTMRFNDDWTGFFIRGDDLFFLHGILEDYLSVAPSMFEVTYITGLMERMEEAWTENGTIQK